MSESKADFGRESAHAMIAAVVEQKRFNIFFSRTSATLGEIIKSVVTVESYVKTAA